MKLTDISTIREIMGRHGVSFQKKFGQNFLINPRVPENIAEAACEKYGDAPLGILEIGPGIGTLTRELAARADKVVALEIDTNLIPILDETLADFDNTLVINEDVLKTDLAELCEREFFSNGMKLSVAANLPYYITTPILMKLVESRIPFETITVMIQKEVAQRLCAPAGDSEYGAITASLSYYGSVERLFTVPAGCFLPAPKVDSAVLKLDLWETTPVNGAKNEVFRVIRAAFANRRKTFSNGLCIEYGKKLSKQAAEELLVSMGFAPNVRGEALSVEQFGEISVRLHAYFER